MDYQAIILATCVLFPVLHLDNTIIFTFLNLSEKSIAQFIRRLSVNCVMLYYLIVKARIITAYTLYFLNEGFPPHPGDPVNSDNTASVFLHKPSKQICIQARHWLQL